MKFLIVGLGSMGKRRIRNLLALNYTQIAGFDPRIDRREEAKQYDISLFDNFEKAYNKFKPDTLIISTPPNLHMKYAYFAYENSLNCFIEASVVEADKILQLYKLTLDSNFLIAPSCTMMFFPAPKKIKELINNLSIGKVLNINYHTGQYLPDWHPWESIKDFYVSNPNTGGCREIVPFELTWINDIFGDATPYHCLRTKLTDIDSKIDDIYHCLIKYPENIIANITIEVVSRPKATRELVVLGTEGKLIFSGETNTLKYINTKMNDWEIIKFDSGTIQTQYINPEEPYIEEINSFISGIKDKKNNIKSKYPNNLYKDYNILQTLYKLEDLSEGKNDLSR